MTFPKKSLTANIGSQRNRQPAAIGDHNVEQDRKPAFESPSSTRCNNNFETLFASAEPRGGRGIHASGRIAKANERFSEHVHRHRLHHSLLGASEKKRIRVLKFGGTSVGDAPSIERAVEIVRASTLEITSVVVVSAMNGVTNQLVEAASAAGAGNHARVSLIFKELRKRHETAAGELIHATGERNRIGDKMREVFQLGERACCHAVFARQLTPHARDLILSIGERASAFLVAGALAERGVPSEPVDATELLVTDSNHGSAEPRMELTRERCSTRLRPLMRQSVVPVVTGFIGTTVNGAVTTLGRGSSDYSATILGAALDAHEVVIWTDVDGVLTADPRLVPAARTIPEMSYHEAAELARFGAKVMHPKIFHPLKNTGIPIWVRNTFAPERPGTKITPLPPPPREVVKALTSSCNVAMITVTGPSVADTPDVVGRIFTTTAGIRADLFLRSQPSSLYDICFLISAAVAEPTVQALSCEFAQDLAHGKLERITLDSTVAIVTLVSENVPGNSKIAGRACGALAKEHVAIIVHAQGSTECTNSFVIARKDVGAALVALHCEFQLDAKNSQSSLSTNL